MKGIYEDLTGWHQPNGRWTVIERGPDGIDKHGNKYVRWWCQCDCHGDQSKKLLRTHTITSEDSKSCGCWNREIHKDVMKKNKRYNKLTEEEIKAKVEAKGNQFISAEYILKGGKYRWQICIVCKECGELYTTLWDSYKNKSGTCPECSVSNSHREQRLKKAKKSNLVEAYPNILNLWDYDKNEDIPENYSCRSNCDANYICNICGHPWHGRINTIYMKSWSRGLTGCAVCAGQIATPETCIATTHPYLIDYFVNKDDAYKYKARSNQRADLKCPLCGTKKGNMLIESLTGRGFNCPSCGDKTSLPERYMYNLLMQMEEEFTTQEIFSWSKNKRYDFYLEQYNLIIETHGSQHYDNHNFSHMGGKTLREEQENDLLKYNLAIKNGYNIICVDCRKSDTEYIKNSILSSELNEILDFTNVDWDRVDIDSYINSIIHKSSILWNEGKSTIEISDIVHRTQKVVARYLLKANKLNWCQYNGDEDLKRRNIILGQNFCKPVYCFELDKEFPSVTIAEKETGVRHISSCCLGTRTYAGRHPITGENLHWCFVEEKEIYQIREPKTNGIPIICVETRILYKSALDAERQTGIFSGNISAVVRGDAITAGGYHWCEADKIDEYKPRKRKFRDVVVMCVETNKVYRSAVYAEECTGVRRGNISSTCNGRQKSAGGYNWKHLYDQTRKDGTIIPGAITLGFITEEEAFTQLTQQND